ncbi:MAG: helix-hairpin-helix domain-containing protein, partial [Spirochaetota bacterium]|nr:helix-hairpin-helix domain-containing protein [Spirochaetota bacterium]
SLNLGIQLEPAHYIMIELGATNIMKEPSDIVHDYSEQFYTGATFMLLDDLAVRLTLHRFEPGRINMNLLTRYYITGDYFIGANLSSEPRVLCVSAGAAGSYGSIKVFAGMQEESLFVFFSYTLFYSVEPRHHKSVFPKTFTQKDNQSSHLININSADEIKLSTLPNIGPKTARKIIAYRKANGPFYSAEDLMWVTGIGPKKYNKLKQFITVGKLNPKKRFANVRLWTMREFVELGFTPALALRLVLFIRDREMFSKLDDLLRVKGFDKSKLEKLKAKLNEYKNLES